MGQTDENVTITYGYDALGRLNTVITAVQTTYRYNAGNQMISRVDEEGEQSYAYDRRWVIGRCSIM